MQVIPERYKQKTDKTNPSIRLVAKMPGDPSLYYLSCHFENLEQAQALAKEFNGQKGPLRYAAVDSSKSGAAEIQAMFDAKDAPWWKKFFAARNS